MSSAETSPARSGGGADKTVRTSERASAAARALMVAIAGYRRFISPLIPPRCRFPPPRGPPRAAEVPVRTLVQRVRAGGAAGARGDPRAVADRAQARSVPALPSRWIRSGPGSVYLLGEGPQSVPR